MPGGTWGRAAAVMTWGGSGPLGLLAAAAGVALLVTGFALVVVGLLRGPGRAQLLLAGTAVVAVTAVGAVVVALVASGVEGRGTYGGGTSPCVAPPVGGTVVTFLARDMGGMMGPAGPMMFMPRLASVPAGPVTLELRNVGTRPHELLVFRLAPGQRVGQRPVGADDRVSEQGMLAEVEPVCRQDPSVDGTVPGNVARATVTLSPGRYEVLCNLTGHYRNGMYSLLVVT